MPTLINELIEIPERVSRGDFVLTLAQGLDRAEETVRSYVVTPQLERCFDDALAFIRSSIDSRTSKAAYLHGSFGAGKSHFMAILNLILAGNVAARSIPELASVVARHNAWTEGRRFLMVPYHMIGARSVESALFGQYARHVQALHPDAPVPGFYLAESLFADAQALRQRQGDQRFFADLNDGKSDANADTGGWGELGAGLWDATGFEAAILEPPSGAERRRLIADLIARFFSSYKTVAEGGGEAFVPIDDGLAIMSQHAAALGYDAVILFLDEMILWLATHAADFTFVSSEGAKLSKLVEAQRADRPIPLVSFVARQRDLRDLVGENLAGALQLGFADVLKWWEARFDRITLEDRNLPAIAEKRVLRPRSEAARQTLDAAFEETQQARREVLDTLLTTEADRALFRQVYPFSPALVQALIAVSSVLQRERTALRLMVQLLVDRRDELELGQLIPVGDLYDVIAEGDEPFTDSTRIHFENAKKLYAQKLLPLLEGRHGVAWQDVLAGSADADKAVNLRNDARLIKTLLLAALVPEVPALKALTGQRLAALNHGTVRSPIPGLEGKAVLTRCREWATQIGEIKITDDANPVISVQITGIDSDPIIANAGKEDNQGNRRRKIRTMLFEALEIREGNELFSTFELRWRGTKREVDVVYDNVREMSDDRLRGRGGDGWTVVLDFPFDDPGHGPKDDIDRLGRFAGSASTLVWLPSFLSDKAQHELGRLVILDYLLASADRFERHAGFMSAVDRAQAKAILTNQHSQLQQRLNACLRVAYGIDGEPRDAVQSPLDGSDHLQSMDRAFQPQIPVGGSLKEAFERLLDRLFAYRYPAHPEFEEEARLPILRGVRTVLQQAIAAEGGRVHVADKATRQHVRSIANPLKLGEMAETHFVLGHHWPQHFSRLHHLESGGDGAATTVGMLRRWIDQPQVMGLPDEVANLVILTFAEQTNRSFRMGGAVMPPALEKLPDDWQLRQEALPPGDHWRQALHRTHVLFGLVPPEMLNAANVATLAGQVADQVLEVRPAVERICRDLPERLRTFGADPAVAHRLKTARSAQALLASLATVSGAELVSTLAQTEVATSEAAMSQTIGKAAMLDDALNKTDWAIFEAVGKLADERRSAAGALLARTAEVLAADEHVIALQPAIAEVKGKALALLTDIGPVPAPPTPAPPSAKVIERERRNGLAAGDARQVLTHIGRRIDENEDCTVDISWEIRKRGQDA